jgi:hypothetical protein
VIGFVWSYNVGSQNVTWGYSGQPVAIRTRWLQNITQLEITSRSFEPFVLIFLPPWPLKLPIFFHAITVASYIGGSYHPHPSLFRKFALVLNSVLLFCKPLVFDFLLGTSDIFLCSMSVPQAKIGSLLNMLQLFAEMLTYLEPEIFLIISLMVLIRILILRSMNEYIYIYLHVA